MPIQVPRAWAFYMTLSYVTKLSHSKKMFLNKNYNSAKKGDKIAALKLIDDLCIYYSIFNKFNGFICPVRKINGNMIPWALGYRIYQNSDAVFFPNVYSLQSRLANHISVRIFYNPMFTGYVAPGNYILIDDYFTTGTTLSHLVNYINSNTSSKVVNAFTLSCSRFGVDFQPNRLDKLQLKNKFPDIDRFIDSNLLTKSHIKYIMRFKSLQSFYNRYSEIISKYY